MFAQFEIPALAVPGGSKFRVRQQFDNRRKADWSSCLNMDFSGKVLDDADRHVLPDKTCSDNYHSVRILLFPFSDTACLPVLEVLDCIGVFNSLGSFPRTSTVSCNTSLKR